MNKHIIPLLVALLFSHTPFAAQEGSLEAGLVNPGYVEHPAWFKHSFLDIREDIAEAAENDKRLLLYFYQDGCPYCERLIRHNFAQRDIVEKTQAHFDVVAINLWGDTEVTDLDGNATTEKEFAKSLRVQFTPTMLFLDEAGAVALRVNGYYAPHKFDAALDYVAQKKENELRFREYFAQRDTRPASGKLHVGEGYLPVDGLARKPGGRPLLVLLEQKVCAVCDELHGETMRRVETVKLLRHFDVALVDIESKGMMQSPEGRELKVSDWIKKMGLQYTPSLLFFDDSGKEVFRTEAYLRPFHVQSAMEYVSSGAYKEQPEFQRFVQDRADHLREQGIEVDIWE